MVNVRTLALATALACSGVHPVEVAQEVQAALAVDAWRAKHEPALKAIVERCLAGRSPPDQWHFREPGHDAQYLSSYGLTGHPPTSESEEDVNRCIDEAMQALPPFPAAPPTWEAGVWMVRW